KNLADLFRSLEPNSVAPSAKISNAIQAEGVTVESEKQKPQQAQNRVEEEGEEGAGTLEKGSAEHAADRPKVDRPLYPIFTRPLRPSLPPPPKPSPPAKSSSTSNINPLLSPSPSPPPSPESSVSVSCPPLYPLSSLSPNSPSLQKEIQSLTDT